MSKFSEYRNRLKARRLRAPMPPLGPWPPEAVDWDWAPKDTYRGRFVAWLNGTAASPMIAGHMRSIHDPDDKPSEMHTGTVIHHAHPDDELIIAGPLRLEIGQQKDKDGRYKVHGKDTRLFMRGVDISKYVYEIDIHIDVKSVPTWTIKGYCIE